MWISIDTFTKSFKARSRILGPTVSHGPEIVPYIFYRSAEVYF